MKITFVGTGTMGCITRCNTSVLIDNILFDIGMGTVKQLERLKIYTKKVEYLVITHFHADHFFDIPNLLIGRGIRKETENKLVIVGPKGVREKTVKLMQFTHSDGNPQKYDRIEEKYNLEFVELENKEEYIAENFKIQALELQHGGCKPVNGYILEKDGIKLAYACDTGFCENYYKMCEECDYMLSDVTGLKSTDTHIGLDEYKELYKKYENCKFYAIHRADYDINGISNIKFPMDGEIEEI